LDGETNLKLREALQETIEFTSEDRIDGLEGEVQCEQPNSNLYKFNGNIKLASHQQASPLNLSSLLLRGAKLMNTDWICGVVVYSGHETKLLMNSSKAPLKWSNIDKTTNAQIVFLFFILIVIALASALGSLIVKNNGDNHTYISHDNARSGFFFNFITFFILYNNLIPISLLVTIGQVSH